MFACFRYLSPAQVNSSGLRQLVMLRLTATVNTSSAEWVLGSLWSVSRHNFNPEVFLQVHIFPLIFKFSPLNWINIASFEVWDSEHVQKHILWCIQISTIDDEATIRTNQLIENMCSSCRAWYPISNVLLFNWFLSLTTLCTGVSMIRVVFVWKLGANTFQQSRPNKHV